MPHQLISKPRSWAPSSIHQQNTMRTHNGLKYFLCLILALLVLPQASMAGPITSCVNGAVLEGNSCICQADKTLTSATPVSGVLTCSDAAYGMLTCYYSGAGFFILFVSSLFFFFFLRERGGGRGERVFKPIVLNGLEYHTRGCMHVCILCRFPLLAGE